MEFGENNEITKIKESDSWNYDCEFRIPEATNIRVSFGVSPESFVTSALEYIESGSKRINIQARAYLNGNLLGEIRENTDFTIPSDGFVKIELDVRVSVMLKKGNRTVFWDLPGGDPGRIAAVREGRAGVEDEGSQLAALILAEAPLQGRDEHWLDLCAGPGGKAALLGARAAQRGARLTANEIAPHRADLVRAAVSALNPGVVEVRCGDGRAYGTDEPGGFDRILVDAPCSGLGSLRRRPEARWRRTPKDVTELAALQRELLTSALGAVRRGGLVAYVTCSPHVLETELVVRDVLRHWDKNGGGAQILHAGDAATRIAPRPPAGAERPMLQLWPHADSTDAMFCALLRRTL